LFALLAVAGLGYAALALPSVGRNAARWLLGALVVGVALLLAAGLSAPPAGLKASYWASATPSGVPEQSTDFSWLSGATRIEPALNLRGDDFGVFFFNDAVRFNVGADAQPGRDQMPFSARWEGWLLVPSTGPRQIAVDSAGAAQVWLDQTPLSAADSTVQLTAGLHQFRVDYTRPEAKVPALHVRWQRDPGGELVTLGGDDLRWQPNADSVQLSAVVGGLGRMIVAAVVLIWLGLGVWRLWRRPTVATVWRAVLWLVPLLFLAYGMLLEAPLDGRTTILSGLDDWLIYESSARDILLNGPLMAGGQGHAPPFYGQPLYPYVLAVAHRLTGESLYGPISLQFGALGLVVLGTAVLAQRAFGNLLDGLVAAAAFLVLLQVEPEHFRIARQLFNENLYMPLVMASLIVLVSLARRRQPAAWWQALLTGVLLGVTAISRSQFLAFVPLGMLIVWLAWRRGTDAGLPALGAALLIGVGVVLVIAPVTARNWMVSGELVPISGSGGASLLEFHRPPPGLIDQSALAHDPLYDALHLDQPTRTVVAFARADPAGYLATLLPLGAHSIGLPGRNDAGVYWPLLATVAAYAASFGLRRTRRLQVWPVHAFVGTHLLILMLFEADTYGYRLVMPMYAPMVAVAAQVPLEIVRALLRSRAGTGLRSGDRIRAARFAGAGWAVVALGALVWQSAGLVQVWPERETTLHGLGGAAAHAALTADRIGAGAIYVASVDGTPRHFGAGTLPGLRYPWFKWFDPQRSLPLPDGESPTVYVLSELRGQTREGDLTACLGPPDASGEVVVQADQARQSCLAGVLADAPLGVTFDGLARIDALSAPASAAAGDTVDTRLAWRPLVAHPAPQQVSVQLDDPSAGDGTLWGNGTFDLYPAAEWQADESLLSRVPLATDPTAIPQTYRLSVGIGSPKPGANPAMATWQGTRTDRVAAASLVLTPGMPAASAALPPDMRPLDGPALIAGGLELIAARPLPAQVAIGSPLRIGLLWRAVQDGPTATQLKLRLVGGDGDVLQESVVPLLGGRAAPSALRAGNVVRDEQSVVVDANAPDGPVSLELSMADASLSLGSLDLTGRSHVLDRSGAQPLATFGGGMALLSAQVSPGVLSPGDKLTVSLRWRSAAQMAQAYKVFVHVLDEAGQRVIAQQDAEPQAGKAPTTGWVVGEVLDDTYTLVLPAGLAAGEYPLELGVYEPRSGERLPLGNGDNHLLLATHVQVH
jgi:hypothetical protein